MCKYFELEHGRAKAKFYTLLKSENIQWNFVYPAESGPGCATDNRTESKKIENTK